MLSKCEQPTTLGCFEKSFFPYLNWSAREDKLPGKLRSQEQVFTYAWVSKPENTLAMAFKELFAGFYFLFILFYSVLLYLAYM